MYGGGNLVMSLNMCTFATLKRFLIALSIHDIITPFNKRNKN